MDDLFFFFKQKTAYEMRISDWSSDVCSSDLRDSTSPNRNWGWLWVRWADNHPQNGRSGSAQGDGGADEVDEVVALVVDDDEGGEVLDLDLPDRLHPQLGVLDHPALADAVPGQAGRRSASRSTEEPTVGCARVVDLPAAAALGRHPQPP